MNTVRSNGRVWRSAEVIVRHPVESWDRFRLRTARGTPDGPGEASLTPAATSEWNADLHALLDAPWPCGCFDDFEPVWAELALRISGGTVAAGSALDGSFSVARTCYAVVRHIRPNRVVETGVARGVTSCAILEALEQNRVGALWSVDLPPLTTSWGSEIGSAVPESLRSRWTYVRGTSKRRLPPLLARTGSIDLFVHDSLHSYEVMTFELEQAWTALRPGGMVIADDVHENRAFEAFAIRHVAEGPIYGLDDTKPGGFGILRKVW